MTETPPRKSTLLRPVPVRDFPGQRWVRISVRTWHLAAMGFLLGGTALGLSPAEQPAAVWHTFASGAVFSTLELYHSGIWLYQLKGWAVMAKFILLGGWVLSAGHGLAWLLAALIIGGISSHMPGRYRYYCPWYGRVVKE